MSRLSNPSHVCEPSPAPIAASQIDSPQINRDGPARSRELAEGSNSTSQSSENRQGYLEAFRQVESEIRRNIADGAPNLPSDERSPQELSLREVETLIESPTLPQSVQALWTHPSIARLSSLNKAETQTLLDWIEQELRTSRHLRRGRLLGARLKTLVRQRAIASRSSQPIATKQDFTAHSAQDGGYEIRLNLLGVDQSTWRAIQVPDMTLDQLSDVIRASFEWDARLAHRFTIHGVPFSPWRCAGPFWPIEEQAEDEFDWKLSELVGISQIGEAALGSNWLYQLGPWIHEVVVGRRVGGEVVLPHCVDGEGSLNAVRPTALSHLRLVTAAGALESIDEEGVVATRVPRSTMVANPEATAFDVARTTTAMRRCG